MKSETILFIMLLLACSSCKKETLQATDYLPNQNLYLPNPNGDSVAIADPHVIKVGNEWFLYGTGYSSEGLAAWSTHDLKEWKFEGIVWRPTPGSWNTRDIWAPEVIQGDNGFYIYYTASGRIGVAYSTSPRGPFTDVYDHPFIGGGYGGVGDGVYLDGPLSLLDFEEYAIDAHVFKDTDGSLTMYFSIQNPFSLIVAVPMVNYRELMPVRPKIVIDVNLLSWEFVNREAPFVIKHKGIYHLMYSGNLWFTNDYAVGDATSTSPMGPFNRRADNPILRKDAPFNVAGCGHHSVVEGKYNDLLIFYHTRNWGDQPDAPRYTRYMKLYFDSNGKIQIEKTRPQ